VTVFDTVLSVVLLFVAAIPIGLAGAWFTTRGPNALAGFFRPSSVTELGWPRGVQEEDAPVWNWDHPVPAVAPQGPEAASELVELDATAAVGSHTVRAARVTRA
jgi:hypothetical protein